jgi:hypothetical protein
MGFLDALSADTYPRDSRGRRVFEPYGRRGKAYILPDERADQIARFARRFFPWYFVALFAAAFGLGPWGVAAVFLLLIAAMVVATEYATRGLELSSERPAMSVGERRKIGLAAMGRPTMYAICLGAAAVTVVGASLLFRGERNFGVWFLTFYGALICVLYGWRLSGAREVPPAS